MKPIIVLLSSDLPKQGKDTFGEMLSKCFNDNFLHLYPKRFAFATELKKFVFEKYNIDAERAETDVEYKESIRPFYIKEGDGARVFNSLIWCQKLTPSIKLFIENCLAEKVQPVVIITDCRYSNEDDYFKEIELCGFEAFVYTVHIVVNDSIMLERFGPATFEKLAATQRSRSQRELNFKLGAEFDAIIDNNGSYEELYAKANAYTNTITKKFFGLPSRSFDELMSHKSLYMAPSFLYENRRNCNGACAGNQEGA